MKYPVTANAVKSNFDILLFTLKFLFLPKTIKMENFFNIYKLLLLKFRAVTVINFESNFQAGF